MKRLFTTVILGCLILVSKAEIFKNFVATTTGIRFEEGLHWKQILAKAKAEGKYIFVDCFATWCIPCKKMEKEVYSLQKVGAMYNDKFIAIKIQMDSGKNDNDVQKEFYSDARYLGAKYKINGFPTLLFFMPDGRIVNKTVGTMQPDDFIQLAADVIDPRKNYYKLLEDYKQEKSSLSDLSYLAHASLQLLEDTIQSEEIVKAYVFKLKENEWFSKSNIEFMREFTKSTKDSSFTIFFQHADTINKIMEDNNYAYAFISYFIYKDIVLPSINIYSLSLKTPNWDSSAAIVRGNYNDYYSDRVILQARIGWARKHKNWADYTKYLVFFIEKYNILNSPGKWQDLMLNNNAWEVFRYSNNTKELEIALGWSGRAVAISPQANWIDTYANILYKLGRKEQAMKWEEVAVKLNPVAEDIKVSFEKMKKGEPTWK